MTRKIYKYPLLVQTRQEIQLPIGFKILTAGLQADNPFIWCLVNPEETTTVTVQFILIGTGEELAYAANTHNYIGTFHTRVGFVFHLFEKITQKEYVIDENS